MIEHCLCLPVHVHACVPLILRGRGFTVINFVRSRFYYSKIIAIGHPLVFWYPLNFLKRGGCSHLSLFANTAEKLDELKAYLLQDVQSLEENYCRST